MHPHAASPALQELIDKAKVFLSDAAGPTSQEWPAQWRQDERTDTLSRVSFALQAIVFAAEDQGLEGADMIQVLARNMGAFVGLRAMPNEGVGPLLVLTMQAATEAASDAFDAVHPGGPTN